MRSLWFTFPVLIFALAALFAASPGRAPTALAVPPNDNFANAIAITTPTASGVVATASTTGATTEAGEPISSGTGLTGCAPGIVSPPSGSTVWYTWTSPGGTGTIVFDTYGSDYDTVLAVYTGSAVNALTKVVCNDDFGSNISAVTLSYAASTVYRIQVGGFGGGSGNAVLNMSLGAEVVVDSSLDSITSADNVVTLREAMSLATGALSYASLSTSEKAQVLNSAALGAGGADLIHFTPSSGTITLGSALPDLNTNNDVVSGIGSGVIVSAGGAVLDCFHVSGNSNHIEAMVITGCGATNNAAYAVLVPGNNNVIGSTIPGLGNAINNNGIGISLDGNGNKVFGNFIGTDGLNGVPNGFGVGASGSGNIIGGAAPGEGNVIVAISRAVGISGAGASVVKGNKIGTDAAGSRDINSSGGSYGVYIIGPDNVIGGSGAGDGNLISGNGTGIFIKVLSTNNSILGNHIGTDAAGVAAIPNDVVGIDYDGVTNQPAETNFIGGASPGAGNIISGNTGPGIRSFGGVGAVIKGNKIGVGATGGSLPNGGDGLNLANAVGNVIGGTAPGEGNMIAFNTGNGVALSNNYNRKIMIRGNSIYSNSSMGISIFSGTNDGVVPPVIGSTAATAVTGGACPLCTVDLYNDSSNQGRFYLGSATADGSGNFSITAPIHSLAFATATATDANGNTSQFSFPVAWPANSDGDGLPDANDACPSQAEDADGFQDGDGCPDPDNDSDGVCDAGQTSASCIGSDTGKLCFDPAGTLSCTTQDCRNIGEDFDAFKDSDGCPEPDNDNDGFPDATDACPGAGSGAGADGMLGSPQDLNHNGIQDGGEATLTTDDVPTYAFEDRDGVLDTDGCHDSPGEDFDADGYTDDNEALKIGTDAGYPCGIGGWPSNVFDGGASANKFDVQDIISFVAPVRRLDTNPTGPTASRYNPRWDLSPGVNSPFTTFISIYDVTTMLTGNQGSPAYPPMFGGPRAFGKTCPLASQ